MNLIFHLEVLNIHIYASSYKILSCTKDILFPSPKKYISKHLKFLVIFEKPHKVFFPTSFKLLRESNFKGNNSNNLFILI